MKFPLAAFVIIAIIGIGTLALNFNSEVTGQPITIDKISPEMIKQVRKSIQEQEKYTPPPEEEGCYCPDYGGQILTVQEAPMGMAGLSFFDCIFVDELIKVRKKSKMSTKELEQWQNLCKKVFPYLS